MFWWVRRRVRRSTRGMHGGSEPGCVFLPILACGLAPWLLPFFSGLRDFFKEDRAEKLDSHLFLVRWIAVVFLFFSISGSKMPSYILPLFPALALLIGRRLAEARPRRLLVAQAALAGAAGIALVVFSSSVQGFLGREMLNLSGLYVPWLAAAGVLLAAASIAGGVAAWRGAIPASVALLAIGGFRPAPSPPAPPHPPPPPPPIPT